MQDGRARRLGWSWIGAATVAAGLLLAGSLAVLASGSDDDDSKTRAQDDEKKREVHVIVSGDGEEPMTWVSTDDGDDGDPKGAYLGVSIDEDTKNPEGGARVDSVAENSPADKAGIRLGDTIVGFGGSTIRGPARLTEKIHAAKPGDRVDVKVIRKEGGKSETLSVEMGARPKSQGFWYGTRSGHGAPNIDLEALGKLGGDLDRLRVLKVPHGRAWRWRGDRPRLGVELVETTPELREYLGGSRESGVLVGKVLANTPAQSSGLRVGDLIVSVDGDRIEDVGGLIEAVADKEGKTIDLELVREHKSTRIQVTIPKLEEEEDEPTGPRAMRSRAPRPMAPPILEARLRLLAARDALHDSRRQEAMERAREAVERARFRARAASSL